jgi:hypothetical protein
MTKATLHGAFLVAATLCACAVEPDTGSQSDEVIGPVSNSFSTFTICQTPDELHIIASFATRAQCVAACVAPNECITVRCFNGVCDS